MFWEKKVPVKKETKSIQFGLRMTTTLAKRVTVLEEEHETDRTELLTKIIESGCAIMEWADKHPGVLDMWRAQHPGTSREDVVAGILEDWRTSFDAQLRGKKGAK